MKPGPRAGARTRRVCAAAQAFRGAIDHHRRLLQGCLTCIGGLHAEFFKIGQFLFFDSELGPPTHEAEDFHTVIEQRPILVEGDLVDLQIVLQIEATG